MTARSRRAADRRRIEAVLADFRGWLEGGADDRGDADPPASPEPVDLHTLVAQFTALRHEVNLQTRASRAAVEQTAETIKLLDLPKADPRRAVRPLVKALIDVADALAVAWRQVEKARAAAGRVARTSRPLRGPASLPDCSEPPGCVRRTKGPG